MSQAVLDRPLTGTETVKSVADPREARAVPSLAGFALIMVQLAALMAVFRVFSLEERSFHMLAALSFAGFAVHYWLPFKFKEWFWIALSLGGAYVLIDPRSATALIAIGLVIYGIATAIGALALAGTGIAVRQRLIAGRD